MQNKVNITKSTSKNDNTKGIKKDLKALIKKVLVILFILFIIFQFIFGLARMKGIQMNPKITDGDLILYYRLNKKYLVGDVVTFKKENERYILRIVALEGQKVDITENGEFLVDNHTLEEEIYYNTYKIEGSDITFPYVVEAGKVFVLGDFRMDAVDSRKFGSISIKEIEGKVVSIIRNRNL